MSAVVLSKSIEKVVLKLEIELGSSMLDSEKKIQQALNEAGVKATGALLERFDTNGRPINMGSFKLTSKGQVECAYQTPYGEVTIPRHVYQSSKGGKTFCPLEQNARIIRSATPFFAKQISSKYAEFGGRRVVNDLSSNHGREIVHTYIQNVADTVASIAILHEEDWSYETPAQNQPVPVISVGLDGTTLLTVTNGYRQAMVGSVALYSSFGDRLHTTYIAATPEYGKATFIERLEREIEHVKKQYPNALMVGIADGAKDNWPFLNKHTDLQVLDFYHATEYLSKAAQAVFRKTEDRATWLERACSRLKHNKTGPDVLYKELLEFSLMELSEDKRDLLEGAITYFKNQKKKMIYARNIEDQLPIGSGVTEAACKLIVKQRLCSSGMRWKESGASAVLSLRCLTYTEGRWEQFWQKIDADGYSLAA